MQTGGNTHILFPEDVDTEGRNANHARNCGDSSLRTEAEEPVVIRPLLTEFQVSRGNMNSVLGAN